MNCESIISDQQRRIVVLQKQIEVEREINFRLKSRPQFEATAIRQGEIIAELQVEIQRLRRERDSHTDARNIALNERDTARAEVKKLRGEDQHQRIFALRRIITDMRERLGYALKYTCEPVNPRLAMMLEEQKCDNNPERRVDQLREHLTTLTNAEHRFRSWLDEDAKVTGENFRRNVDMQKAGS